MAYRYFTADFHLGMTDCLRFDKRGIIYGGLFKSIDDMNQHLIDICKRTLTENDMLYHVGDLATFKADRGNTGLKTNPMEIVNQIPGMFMNIRGNHDINNKVKSICESMRLHLGKRYPDVSMSHYPSYDRRAKLHFLQGDIHICGHVHGLWKHCLDLDNQVLNINVGVDVWNYKLVSEQELIQYIDQLVILMRNDMSKINKVHTVNGKIVYA